MTGLAVGGDATGSAIGVAPGAQWIVGKTFNDDGQSTFSATHEIFQWLLDPDGDPATDDAPDVVNNSWGFPELAGSCYTEFEADIEALVGHALFELEHADWKAALALFEEADRRRPDARALWAARLHRLTFLADRRSPGASSLISPAVASAWFQPRVPVTGSTHAVAARTSARRCSRVSARPGSTPASVHSARASRAGSRSDRRRSGEPPPSPASQPTATTALSTSTTRDTLVQNIK